MLLATAPAQQEITPAHLRPLGSLEELLWQMNKQSPMHAILIDHIDGSSTITEWSAALEQTRRRHPLWSARIAPNAQGKPCFQQNSHPKLPLHTIKGDFSKTWEQEIREYVYSRLSKSQQTLEKNCRLPPLQCAHPG